VVIPILACRALQGLPTTTGGDHLWWDARPLFCTGVGIYATLVSTLVQYLAITAGSCIACRFGVFISIEFKTDTPKSANRCGSGSLKFDEFLHAICECALPQHSIVYSNKFWIKTFSKVKLNRLQ